MDGEPLSLEKMQISFRQGLQEGFKYYLPYSIGFLIWALVTGMTMRSSGLSLAEVAGMNILVYGATAQLATLPLMERDAPVWLIGVTALMLNLRFMAFSATLAPVFRGTGVWQKWLVSYLLVDGVVATCKDQLLAEHNRSRRLGFYMGPALWAWISWQLGTFVGAVSFEIMPIEWPLYFLATIALLTLLVPMCRERSILVSAVVGGVLAISLRELPLNMGLVFSVFFGMLAGFIAKQMFEKK